jgi:hypothetical protein
MSRLAYKLVGCGLLLGFGASTASASDTGSGGGKYDDAAFCSKFLAAHLDTALTPVQYRSCMIAIATTYIESEQNSIPPEQMLMADDVAKHQIGTPRVNKPGSRAVIIAAQPRSYVIGAIRNRRWSVDGNHVWILYDGYFKTDLTKPEFDVGERFTIEKGLIEEVLVAAVAHPR